MKKWMDGKWKWATAAVMLTLIIAGCAGTTPPGSNQSPKGQGQSAAMENLPPSQVEVQVEETMATAEPGTPEGYIHTVGFEGETLSLIAKWYTGSLGNWKGLAEANPEIDPNRIFIGNEILIPEELLITRDPMPRSFITESYSRKPAQ